MSAPDGELYIVGRFHARPGCEAALLAALRDVAAPTRAEHGCLAYAALQSLRDPRLFFVHSRWRDEAAFDLHAGLPHTTLFIARAEALIDHDLDVNRTRLVA